MSDLAWVFVAMAWFAGALVVGYVMGRMGYDAYSWTLMSAFLGPLIVPVAIAYLRHPPSREPTTRHAGERGSGPIDVLVGVDGSPESTAAVACAAALFGPRAGRFTLARVVPVDATREMEREAADELDAACAVHPALDPSAVVLRGEPIGALRDYLKQHDYAVLVVGTRGAGRSKALLGGVATGLARGAGIPVLLVDDDVTLATDRQAALQTVEA